MIKIILLRIRAVTARLRAARRRRHLRRAVALLPDLPRRAYHLHCVEQLPLPEVARQLGLLEREVAEHVVTALLELADALSFSEGC